MAEISAFRRWVEVACEGAPRPLVDEAIRAALERLCRYSGVWSLQHPAVDVADGIAAYNVIVPAGGQVIRLEAVHYNGAPLAPSDPAWGVQYAGGSPPFTFWLESASPAPAPVLTVNDTILGTLEFRAIYAPHKTATEIPDFLYDEYEEGVAAGAVAQLLAIPGKGWTDPRHAAEFEKRFFRHAAAAKLKAATGNTNNILPPVFPPTA